MCGSGTIPIEAARLNPRLEIVASDWDPATVEVARATLAAHGLAIEVRTADARALAPRGEERFDWIVTDPPYGVRQARHSSRTRLYGALLAAFARALAPDGRIALIVLKLAALRAAAERSGLGIELERRVDLGRIEPSIVVLARR
jgi:putative N6-adenine-specific DNA methylase/tRNA (guanine6-N2)-methyltransferase